MTTTRDVSSTGLAEPTPEARETTRRKKSKPLSDPTLTYRDGGAAGRVHGLSAAPACPSTTSTAGAQGEKRRRTRLSAQVWQGNGVHQ